MSRLYLLVEGQTEEAFVRELLIPHCARRGVYLSAIIVRTSDGHKGGVVSYAKIRPQIDRLCREHSQASVSTLFDLYALPNDFPGKSSSAYPSRGSGDSKAAFLETCMAEDIRRRNFIPNLLVHEFEALLFSKVECFEGWMDDMASVSRLLTARATDAPEDINDDPRTTPSKRILAAMPEYQKPFHGPLIACDIGLDRIRQACPHFHRWLSKIEALA